MSAKIGLVGYQGSGKTTLFQWLTGVEPDLSLAHVGQTAMALIEDPRLDALQKIYDAKKVTHAGLEICDTPGLDRSHEGNASRLAVLRDVDCLVLVVPAFGGKDPAQELTSFEEDLTLADLQIVANRIERVQEALKKPRSKQDREETETELAVLQAVQEGLESGNPLREADMTAEQQRFTRSFRLLTEKPRMVVVNTADDEQDFDRFKSMVPPDLPLFAAPLGLELELSQMSPDEAAAFREEMGVGGADRNALLRMMMDTSGQQIFLTAGPKEVRSWMFRKGGTAVEAAAAIHTDLARGFIRAEVMSCSDLIRLGSEREVKAQNLVRMESKDYVVDEDDILLIRFSV
ncbi:MAG: redox-regulated ATPase YchF [Planctomycetota bacterium]|nr:MAG: redox-regulated ATPase YchF [Planctomycetota bacterium]